VGIQSQLLSRGNSNVDVLDRVAQIRNGRRRQRMHNMLITDSRWHPEDIHEAYYLSRKSELSLDEPKCITRRLRARYPNVHKILNTLQCGIGADQRNLGGGDMASLTCWQLRHQRGAQQRMAQTASLASSPKTLTFRTFEITSFLGGF
jgi:hypothetical protein